MKINRQLTNKMHFACLYDYLNSHEDPVAPSNKYRTPNSVLHLHVFTNGLLIRQADSRCLCCSIWADEVQTKWKHSTYNSKVDTTAQNNTAHISVCIFYLLVRVNTERMHASLPEIWRFPGGAAWVFRPDNGIRRFAKTYCYRLQGSEFPRRTAQFDARRWHYSTSNVPIRITQWYSVMCQMHGIHHVNLFYNMACQH